MGLIYDPAIAARKARNVEVFKETLQICREGGYSTTRGHIALPAQADVLAASKFYDDPPSVEGLPRGAETVIDAINADCIDVARDLVSRGYKTVLLNMANRHTPGGGVLGGARAQEESLFRQSNLCVSLYQYSDGHAELLGLPRGKASYPMNRDTGGIYSGRVTFFRTGQRDGDKLVDSPFECAVVSVAAINSPELDGEGRLVPWAVEATEKKIRAMLRIGLLHGHDAIVLGAWGCGAFRNPPEHMARIFDSVLHEREFEGKFRIVRFAVIEDHNSRRSNFAPFDRQFNRHSVETSSPRETVCAMKALAERMHNRDTKPRKYTGAPYITHPAKVVDLLESWGYSADDVNDAAVLSIAWGHDLLEDTKVTPEELASASAPQSERIVAGIRRLTFDSRGGADKNAYIRGIAEFAPPECLVVKIADRLSNTLDFCASGDIWAREYLKLGEPLFARLGECKGADLMRATLAHVRETVANLCDSVVAGDCKMTDDRKKGMLWGLVIGDAFGSPIQFSRKDSHPWITEMEPCPVFGLPAGYWTDDSSMAMCVMDSFVRKGGYDLKDIGGTFVKWLEEGYLSSTEGSAFDIGSATSDSVAAIRRGSLVNGAESSQGNGSIMRFAPSYLIGRHEARLGRKAAIEVMHEVSDLTHASAGVRGVVDRFAMILDEHLGGRRTTAKSAYETREEVNNSGWAVSTLEAALWAFNGTATFEEGLIDAVNLGGDSDTIGAVYGQIAGAFYGFSAIPVRWVKAIKDWEKVDKLIDDFLATLAR